MHTPRAAVLASTLGIVLLSGSARAAGEDPAAHGRLGSHTVVLDNDDIRPSTVTINRDEALVFENYALQPMRLRFIEPKDLRDKVRCGLIRDRRHDKSVPPWQLFAWDDGKLTAVIPPGRFASLCSFEPGTYTFVTVQQPQRAAARGLLEKKGELIVK